MTNSSPPPASPPPDATPVVTIAIIAINVIVFVAMTAGGVSPVEPTIEDLLKWGASYGPYELSTEWWRVFTAMFVHIGFVHILLNMYCLYSLGPAAERIFGRWQFAALYLLSGLGGNVASVALHPMIVAAGASGAIFGVAGALLPVLHFRQLPALVSQSGRGRLGIGGFIVYNLIYGFANTGIDNAAHLGGLVIGFIIGYAAPVAESPTARAAVLRTKGVAVAIALSLAAGFAVVREWRESYFELESGRQALIAGDVNAAIARMQRVLLTDPDNAAAHLLLSEAYLHQGKNRDALFQVTQALRVEPNDAVALAQRGYAYQRLGKADSARADYQRALSQPRGAMSDKTRADVQRLLASLPSR